MESGKKKNNETDDTSNTTVGRPPKDPVNLKSVTIKLRLTPSEAAEIRDQASLSGYKQVAPFIVRTFMSKGAGVTIYLNPCDLFMLGQLGNNVNQIAKKINSGCCIERSWVDEISHAKMIIQNFYLDLNSLLADREVRRLNR
ncbi:mobilisation protein (MobC) [Marinobacter sp. es.042]|uniref:plasmid mobilization protein n=1 Tax=Marinobacter sp. es.042 TaxID=1761794 RepID=UPI000B509D22|nr:plasmid mobilization relaxosome protein MobC [Marinobacter sp. es.042]SNB59300.1 mobilisation protein (MobC) [Marinobacter sp. es.042]